MLLEPTPESEEMIHGWPASRIRCYIPWLVRGKMDPLSRRAHDFGELSLLMPAERPSSLLGAAAKLWHRLAFTLAIALALVFGGGRFVRPPAPAHFTAPSTDDSQLARTELRLVPERMQAPAIASKRAHPDRDAVDVRTPTQTHKSRVLAPVDRGLTTASTKPGPGAPEKVVKPIAVYSELEELGLLPIPTRSHSLAPATAVEDTKEPHG
jgi:hypothetical protein